MDLITAVVRLQGNCPVKAVGLWNCVGGVRTTYKECKETMTAFLTVTARRSAWRIVWLIFAMPV